jgi:hypothetical protein
MSQERFDALLGRLADAVDHDPSQLLRRHGLLTVADADVLIAYAPDRQCRLLVDLGPVPGHADAICYRRMLELNLARSPGGWPVLGIHPGNDHVVAILDEPLEALEETADPVELIAQRIRLWTHAWQVELEGLVAHGGPTSPAGPQVHPVPAMGEAV